MSTFWGLAALLVIVVGSVAAGFVMGGIYWMANRNRWRDAANSWESVARGLRGF